MNSKSGIKTTKKPKPELGSGPNQSRRSFAKASLLAPVILSLANRPAWGAVNRCMVSGFSSAMEIGSGDPGNSTTCGYASADTILLNLPIKNPNNLNHPNDIRNQSINTLFACDPAYNPTIGQALNGVIPDGINADYYLVQKTKYFVMAYFNSLPLFDSNNPFPCPVSDVFCYFENNIGGSLNLGNVTLTEAEIILFLKTVFPLEF